MNFSVLENKCIIIKNLGHPKCKSAWANCSYLTKEAASICCQQDPFSGDCCHWHRTDTSSFLRTQNKIIKSLNRRKCSFHVLYEPCIMPEFHPSSSSKGSIPLKEHSLCLKIILFCTIERDKPARSGVSGPASPRMANGNNSAELPNHCIEYIPLFLAPL